jgi:hypothetical protein
MKDAVSRSIRVGDYCVGSWKSALVYCYVVRLTKKRIFTTKGRWDPKQILVINDVPIERRKHFTVWQEEKYGNLPVNTDQLLMEWEVKEEIKNDKDENNRKWGNWQLLSPPPR